MRIIHVLADGSKLDDITGYKLKPDSAVEFYNILKKINKDITRDKKNKEKIKETIK